MLVRNGPRLGWRSMWLLLAGVLGACGDKAPCDEGQLTALIAESPAELRGLQAEENERIRVSVGIRDACRNMSDATRARMMRAYEGSAADTHEAGTEPHGEFEWERANAERMRARVCPGYETIAKAEASGAGSNGITARVWEACDLQRFGLYSARPEAGQRGPTSLFDFAVLLLLTDGGVRSDTAVAAVRALGTRAPSQPGS